MNEIFWLFLRLGITGFGGPIALIAMMEEQVVRKNVWLAPEEFTEAYSICKILPGPVAVQMAIHLGAYRKGKLGGLVAGLAFTFPSFVMVLVLSMFYAQAGALSQGNLGRAFASTQASAIALVMLSTWGLAKPYLKKKLPIAILILCFFWIYFFPTSEPLAIIMMGGVGTTLALRRTPKKERPTRLHSFGLPLFSLSRALTMTPEAYSRLGKLFWICFKAGEFVFGTGLAIIPLLEGEFVQNLHWLTHAEFLDGIALGQVTPGPISISVVFFGFKAAGILGAIIAFAGIYIPAFFNILVVLPRIWKKISGTAAMAGFAGWAFPAVIGGIVAATLRMSLSSLVTPLSLEMLLGSLLAAIFLKVPSWALIPIAGVVGYLV